MQKMLRARTYLKDRVPWQDSKEMEAEDANQGVRKTKSTLAGSCIFVACRLHASPLGPRHTSEILVKADPDGVAETLLGCTSTS